MKDYNDFYDEVAKKESAENVQTETNKRKLFFS